MRAREKQRLALEMSEAKRMRMTKTKDHQPMKSEEKKMPAKKKSGKLKGKKKKFDDESTSSSDNSSDVDDDDDDAIDMEALVEKAMAGAKNSVLHSLCWWRIILGEEVSLLRCVSNQSSIPSLSS